MKTSDLHILNSLLLASFFLFISCTSISHTTYSRNKCLDDQRSALLQLQNALYYAPNFTFFSEAQLWNLNETDCFSWNGVTCDAFGHVIGLDLSSKNLSGSFHSIFNLRHLQRLNLAQNNFNTTLFSYEFGKLWNLTHLNLSDSCFYSQIPLEISYLTRLVSLDLSHQDSCFLRYQHILDPYNGIHYSDPLPLELQQPLKLEKPNFKTLIENLGFLTELYLDSVNISTHSTEWCETTSLAFPYMHVLSLSNCGLAGPFCASLSRLPFLSKLNLNGNPISYLPPNFLEISSHLDSLSLANCNLSGNFPTGILLLPKLQSINISDNPNLMGQLPEFLINNTLRSLSLSYTNFSGNLPESIDNLKFLTNLTLRGCHFSGSIPSSIANLTNLVQLDLSSNNFSGSIPPFHRSGVPNLAHLYLDDNKLSGSIHSSLFTLTSLRTLSLSYNQLGGEIDEFVNASSSLIEYLNLRFNSLRGSIPNSILHLPRLEWLSIGYNSFGSTKIDMFFQLNNLKVLGLSNISLLVGSYNESIAFPQLEALFLSSCNLTEFPEFIKTQDKFVDLNLSFNAIHFPKLNSSFLKSQEKLEALDLSNNNISGAIPNWVWKKSLRCLDLSKNSLSSLDQFLPNQSLSSSQASLQRPICYLSHLRRFNASFNKLAGPIPSCLGNITTLQYLDLQQNNLSGNIPDFARASLLSMLQLNDNKLEGKLPRSLANCVQLRSLKVSGNRLFGRLPRSLASFTKLEVLDLGKNMIHDTFPFWLEKLPSLKVLVLRENQFYGTIKFSFKDDYAFPMLHILDLASNNFSGELPGAFFQSLRRAMMMSDEMKATRNYIGDDYYQDSVMIVIKGFDIFYHKILTIFASLDLSNNRFHGIIPEEIQHLKALKVLNLSHNSFFGPIPSVVGNLTELESLDLSQNKLSGKIPLQLASLSQLIVLILRGNRFSGPVKIVKNTFPSLDVLDISSNKFSGQLSVEFFQGKQLRSLKLSGNRLNGRLPKSLANLTKLEVLDLGKNMIHDTFPFWLEKLPSLKVLVLRENQFYGTIKFSEGGGDYGFPMLRILDLASNNFSGELSVAFLRSLRAMTMITTDEKKAKPNYIGDDYYEDSVTIVNKGFEMFYQKILTIFACLDLSNNTFHGIIPEEIGNLTSLIVLNLSHNSFSSQIPWAIENLKELESLDLSQNKLSGKIPPQLASLTFLAVLNLSYNQLEGSIPQGNQFGIFSTDSYRGNPILCGPPLTKKCNEVVPGKALPKEDAADSFLDGFFDSKIILIGYGCGLVIGLCIGYTVLNEMGNKWLHSYKRNKKRKLRRSW